MSEASEPVRDTAPDERADVEHGEALRLDLIAVLDDANAPSTPTELTSIDGMPLYVGVKTSPTNGRVLQFGFDPRHREPLRSSHAPTLRAPRGTRSWAPSCRADPAPPCRSGLARWLQSV
ncbi:hypothetical protein ACFQ60_03915 [Streptomyces zhihengii]